MLLSYLVEKYICEIFVYFQDALSYIVCLVLQSNFESGNMLTPSVINLPPQQAK